MNLSDTDVPPPPSITPGKYRHYKGRNYEVIGTAVHTETLEPLVIYKPLYETLIPFWVRPFAMFVEVVEIDGVKKPRFERITE